MFGDAGLAAVASEIRDNLHGRGVIKPVKSEQVTSEIRKKSLPYLISLKRKRCGKIKGRGCAEGRKQREFISKEEAFLAHSIYPCTDDNMPHRCYRGLQRCNCQYAWRFSTGNMDEDVWIKFEGEMVVVLLELDPKRYGPCVCHYKGRKFLYA